MQKHQTSQNQQQSKAAARSGQVREDVWVQAKMKTGEKNDIYDRQAEQVVSRMMKEGFGTPTENSKGNMDGQANNPIEPSKRSNAKHEKIQRKRDGLVQEEKVSRKAEPNHQVQTKKDENVQRSSSEVVEKKAEQATIARKPAVPEKQVMRMADPSTQIQEKKDQPTVQTKMTLSQPGDRHEQEADNMASKVMRMEEGSNTKSNLIAAKAESLHRSVDEQLQTKPTSEVQAKSETSSEITPETQDEIQKSTSGGQAMSRDTQVFMEDRFHADFSNVKIHKDGTSANLNNRLGAKAFTYNNHVFFNSGQYQPESREGRYLIAHELTHVIQQTGGGPHISKKSEETVQAKSNSAETPTIPAHTSAPSQKSNTGTSDNANQQDINTTKPPKEGKKGEVDKAPALPNETPPPPQGKDKKKVPLGEVLMPEPPSAISPEDQKRIQGVQYKAGKIANKQTDLPDASENVKGARGAVEEPKEETKARAGKVLVVTMAEKQPPSPEVEKLCRDIRKAIRDKRPPDEDSLVKADPTSAAKNAGAQLDSSIQNNSNQVQNNYNQLQEQPEGTPELQPQAFDTPPQSINAAPPGAEAAVPTEVDTTKALDQDVAASEQQMEDAGMNKESAKLVQSGPIAEARAAQGELVETAKEDPSKVMAAQKAALEKANGDMLALQQSAMSAMSSSRKSTVKDVANNQHGMVESEEQTRTRISKEANTIISTAQEKVDDLLEPLLEVAWNKWEAGVKNASDEFKNKLKEVEDWIDERHSGVGGAIVSAWDSFTGLPGWVTREYNAAEKEFGDKTCDLIREISSDVNTVIASCEKIIDDARKKIDKLFTDLPDGLKEWAKGEQAKFSQKLDSLQRKTTDTRKNFNKELIERAATAVQDVRTEIHALREKAKGLIGRLADAIGRFLDDPLKFIIEGLLELVGISPAAFWKLVNKIKQVLSDIVDDPVGFAKNLLKAIGKGFSQFFDNIGRHLLQGFMDWLLSGLKSAGIGIPKDFSLKSIITFFLELMGISWARIRKLLVKHIGEKNMALIEKAFSILTKFIDLGLSGVIDFLKDKFNPDTIIKKIIDIGIDYLIKALIKQITARILLLFNPVGAIAQAIEAIYRVLKWIFENAAKIFSLIQTVVNGMADIIAGNIAGMANAVEKALVKLISPVIDFLADYIGLGDLPETIADAIKGFQDWIWGLIESGFDWIVAQAKGLLGKDDKKEDGDKKDGKSDGQIGKTVSFSDGQEGHKLWVEDKGNAELVVASGTPKPVEDKLAEWSNILGSKTNWSPEKMSEVKGWINQAKGLVSQTDQHITVYEREEDKNKNPEGQDTKILNSADDKIESNQDELKKLLINLFKAFGEDNDLVVEVVVNDKIRAPYNSDKKFHAVVNNVKDDSENPDDNSVEHKFNWTKLKQREQKHSFKEFNKKWKAGTIDKAPKGVDHSDYKPQNVKPSIVGDYFVLTYDYGPENLQRDELVQMEVRMKVDDVEGRKINHQVVGRNIAIKDPGSRGRVDSAGNLGRDDLDKTDLPPLNAAHILADWFNGSGYKNGLNLILTSDTYNQVTMYRAESQIHDALEEIQDNNPNDLVIFNLQVTAVYEATSDDKVVETLGGKKPDMTKEELKTMHNTLAGKQDPRRCESVTYEVLSVKVNNDTIRHGILPVEIGEDVHLNK